ncbi:MAG: glycosyltransferase family 4 protein [Chloroflexota bacterium]|nr:glycosyltransferase family 4 protein [Chloroflexota bacterium]
MKKVAILSSVHIALDNRVFYREARSLKRAGYDVTLIAVHPHDEIKDGVHILGLPRVARWQRPLLWPRLLRRALETDADIYHFHDPELLLMTPWLRLITGKPTIYDVHEAYPDFIRVKDYMPAWVRYPIAWVFGWLEPVLARLQSALVFADDQIAANFEGVDRPKTTLFNFPARSFVAEAVEATETVDRRDPVILHLGGHERNRGTRLMVEAFHRVRSQLPDARLLLVGHFMPPELEQELRQQIAHCGVDRAVSITGRVPFEEIGTHLKRPSVGWVPWQPVPKNQKNIPTKLFEYMAYGLPVVSSNLDSTRPFVHDAENGYLVVADDPEAHAEALVKLLRNPGRARAMGRRGQRLVETRYNWGEMEERLLALYQELLA